MTSASDQTKPARIRQARISQFDPLDRADWDDLVSRFPQCSFFHTSAWLRVLKQTYNFRPMAITSESQSGPTAVVVLMEVDSWITGKRGVSLPFTDTCPLLYHNQEDLAFAVDAALQTARDRGWKSIEYRSPIAGGQDTPPSVEYYTHTLALHGGPESLLKTFSDSNRRAIRKGQRSNLDVEQATDLNSMRVFYSLLCLTRKRHGIPPQPWRFFQSIQEHILSQGKGAIYLARSGSRAIAGAVFCFHEKKVLYKFGASDTRFQENRPNNLIMWRVIQASCEEGRDSLDFGRTSLDNSGLRRFKQSWGSREQTVPYQRFNANNNTLIPINDATTGWHIRLFNHLPIPLARLAGQLVYKHVA